MRACLLVMSFLAVAFVPLAAGATGAPELPPQQLPELVLPDAVPDLDHLPGLPDLASLFPQISVTGYPLGERPDLEVPLGPPSPLPPEGLPPGLKLGPPTGLPAVGPRITSVPEPGTGVLAALGLALLAGRGRSRKMG
jgi:MYXO-CTERM domain-containing protein